MLRGVADNYIFLDELVDRIFRIFVKSDYKLLNFTMKSLQTLNWSQLIHQSSVQFLIIVSHLLGAFALSRWFPIIDVLLYFFPDLHFLPLCFIANHWAFILINLTWIVIVAFELCLFLFQPFIIVIELNEFMLGGVQRFLCFWLIRYHIPIYYFPTPAIRYYNDLLTCYLKNSIIWGKKSPQRFWGWKNKWVRI